MFIKWKKCTCLYTEHKIFCLWHINFFLMLWVPHLGYKIMFQNMRNCQIFMHVKKITEKNVFAENVWPANLAHCVETVKWLVYNWYSQLTRWCSGNASALGASGPEFNPRLRQGFLCLIFSSPEHKVLRVSYCDRPLSVVRRSPSFVVRRALCVVRRA